MLLILSLLACPLETVDCDAMAALSVLVHVEDDGGDAISEAEVSYTTDGATWMPCEGMGSDWGCGWEVSGEITVRAEAEGLQTTEDTVTVEQGECHVIQQELTLVLPWLDCTDDERPSVRVTVHDLDGQSIPEAQPAYVPHGELWTTPEPCDPSGEAEWLCGWEREGVLDIWVDAQGYTSAYDEVDVPADECHVITQDLDVVLAPAG